MKIDILGAKYTLVMDKSGTNPRLEEAAGYCDVHAKKIVVQSLYEEDVMNSDRMDMYVSKVVRHEVFHAVLHECGLDKYSVDETLVDCLAIQLPKIVEILNKIGGKK